MKRFGRRIGVSERTLHYWKKNLRSPSLSEVQRIADILGVESSWLAYGIDPERK